VSPGGDWARGPARYVAAAVVVAGGVAGLAWSLLVAPTPLPGPVVYVERWSTWSARPRAGSLPTG